MSKVRENVSVTVVLNAAWAELQCRVGSGRYDAFKSHNCLYDPETPKDPVAESDSGLEDQNAAQSVRVCGPRCLQPTPSEEFVSLVLPPPPIARSAPANSQSSIVAIPRPTMSAFSSSVSCQIEAHPPANCNPEPAYSDLLQEVYPDDPALALNVEPPSYLQWLLDPISLDPTF